MKNGCDPENLVNYFKDYPLEFTPGSSFKYCNSGYHLLGLIIERASEMSFEKFIQTNIVIPAEMWNTQIDNNSTIISNRVSGYEEAKGEIQNATYIDMSIPFSAGNIISNANDLNKWYKNLFEYKIISKSSLEKAHTQYQLLDSSFINYGFGWFIDTLQGEKVISHEGGINGFLSSVWYIPSKQTLTVILSNCMCSPTTNTAKIITAFAIGKPLKKNPKIKVPIRTLNKYTGTYVIDGENWQITIKNEDLYFEMANGTGHIIFAKSESEFFSEEWNSQFIFKDNNGIISMTFKYLGGEVSGYKK
jgi:CubicO group peptidase (beta-lactamase class C family)